MFIGGDLVGCHCMGELNHVNDGGAESGKAGMREEWWFYVSGHGGMESMNACKLRQEDHGWRVMHLLR